MAECSVCLPLSKAQLDVVIKVLKSASPMVQLTAVHHTGPVIRYGIFPPHKPRPDIHALYAVDIPDQLGQIRILFTEEQKKQMKEEGIEPCDYVEVESTDLRSEPIGMRYAIVLPPHSMKYAINVPEKK